MKTRSPKFPFAGREYSLLTRTSAMSCWSFSLPALHSCPGMVATSDDSICACCYAQMNRYNMGNVLTPAAARFAWLRAAVRFNQIAVLAA